LYQGTASQAAEKLSVAAILRSAGLYSLLKNSFPHSFVSGRDFTGCGKSLGRGDFAQCSPLEPAEKASFAPILGSAGL